MEIDYDNYGGVVARSYYATTTTMISVMGVQLFMCIYSLCAFLGRPQTKRQGRKKYIVVSFIILILSAIASGSDCYTVYTALYAATDGRNFLEQFELDSFFVVKILNGAAFTAYVVVGDALLLYRCYVICRPRLYLIVLPTLTFLATIAMAALSVRELSTSRYIRTMTSAFILLSVSLNTLVTALITFRLLRARRELSRVLQVASESISLYSGVVSILIESACPLSIFGLCHGIILVATSAPTDTAAANKLIVLDTVFSTLYLSCSVLGPQLIIFRVMTGQSVVRTTEPSSKSTSRPMEFGRGPVERVQLTTMEASTMGNDAVRHGGSSSVLDPDAKYRHSREV